MSNLVANKSPEIVNVVCKAAIIGLDGKLLLLRRTETAPTRPLEWDLIGGAWDGDGQNFEETVIREAEEEAGIKISEVSIIRALPVEQHEPNEYNLVIAFTAKTNDSDVKLSYEHDEYAWVGLSELDDYKLPKHWYQAAEAALKNKNAC